jgi:murein DD-endopeptidase MepM/ murein hydrolase activator NlpD
MFVHKSNVRNKVIISNITKSNIVLSFAISFINYLVLRLRQSIVIFAVGSITLSQIFSKLKYSFIRKMFWGRSSLYKLTFHSFVSFVTLVTVLTGISSRINFTEASYKGFDQQSNSFLNFDLNRQKGTNEKTIFIENDEKDYPEYIYTVESGDTLSKVSKLFQINISTIKWANSLVSESLKEGQKLRIPGVDGVFIKVSKNDTLESIAKKHKGNVADIIDLNSHILDPRDPQIREGMEIFVPGGIIPAPPVSKNIIKSGNKNYRLTDPYGGIEIDNSMFIHPLVSECPGWRFEQKFHAKHGGVDLSKQGGCWINAVANGVVTHADWSNAGQGYNVRIEHENGFASLYYHGNGQFAVRKGDYVKAGQRIMYMGTTGYSTGIHLHLEVRINNVKVNPENHINIRNP